MVEVYVTAIRQIGSYLLNKPIDLFGGPAKPLSVLESAEKASPILRFDAPQQNGFGFGIVRADGLAPRPTYNWLKDLQYNRYINQRPVRTMDVEVYLPDGSHPIGYKYSNKWREGIVIIHDVTVDSLCPTVIKLEPPSK